MIRINRPINLIFRTPRSLKLYLLILMDWESWDHSFWCISTLLQWHMHKHTHTLCKFTAAENFLQSRIINLGFWDLLLTYQSQNVTNHLMCSGHVIFHQELNASVRNYEVQFLWLSLLLLHLVFILDEARAVVELQSTKTV